MNATNAVRPEVKQALDNLREWFPRGSTCYCIIRKVARSGMSRVIGLVSIRTDEKGREIVRHPNYAASVVLGLRRSKDLDGVHVSGCGMDMGFHVVSSISRALYRDDTSIRHEWL